MATIKIELQVDDKGSVKIKQAGDGLDNLGRKAKATQGELSKLFTQGIGQGLGQSMFNGMAGALKAFTLDAVKAQSDQVAAINSLNLALANQGNLLPGVSQSMQDYAGHLMDVSTFSDDAIEKAMAMGASFGMLPGQLKAATQAAVDFSAATGKGLDESMELLGKALAGNAAGLQKMGFHFTEGATGAQKFDQAVAQIEGRFGGSAYAATQTFTGGLEQLHNQVGEAEEGLGKLFGELLGSDRPFGVAIDGAKALAGFLGHDMVIALSEARAQLLELFAAMMRAPGENKGLREALGIGAKIAVRVADPFNLSKRLGGPDVRGAVDDIANAGMDPAVAMAAAAAMDKEAAAARAVGDAAAGAQGHVQDYANGTHQATAGTDALSAAAKKAAEEAKRAGEQFAQMGLTLQDALSREQAKSEGSFFAQLADVDLNAKKAQDEIVRLGMAAGVSDAQIASMLAKQMQLADAQKENITRAVMPTNRDTSGILAAVNAGQIGTMSDGMVKVTKATVDWHAALQDVTNAFQVLGIDAGSVLGHLLGGISAAANAAQGIQKALTPKDGKFGLGNFGKLDFLGKVGVAGQALQMGAALFSGLKGLFHKPEWKGIGEDAGRILGMSVSEELAKAIQKTMKDLHVDVHTASLLNLDTAMSESGLSASAFAPQIMDLLTGIQKGSIPAKEGVIALGKAFTQLKDEAMAASAIGSAALTNILQTARAAGGPGYTKEMREFSAEQVGKAVGAMQSIMAGIAVTSSASAAAQGTIFSATFWASVREQGLGAAVKSMGPAFDELSKKLHEAGIDMPALMGPIAELFGEMTPEVSAIVDGIGGLQQAFEGLSAAGYMTQDSFSAFGTSAVDAFNQATAAGLSTPAALASIAPMLGDIIKAHEQYGLVIDQSTQDLIDQAAAAGIAFPTDPIVAMTQALQDLIATIREANNLPPINPVAGVPAGGGGGGASAGGGGGEGYTPKGYASGGFFTPRPGGHVIRVAEAGRPEWVLNERQVSNLRGSGGGVSIHPGAIQINGAGKNAQQIAAEVMTALTRGGTARRLARETARA